MGVLSAVERNFNETAMHARAQASDRLARADRASHGPRVRAKERAKRIRENPKESPKEPKVSKARTRVKHRNLVSQVLKTRNQIQAWKLRICTNMSIGVLLGGTIVGNQRMTLPQAHFYLDNWMQFLTRVENDHFLFTQFVIRKGVSTIVEGQRRLFFVRKMNTDMYIYTHIYKHTHIQIHVHVHVRVRVSLCFCCVVPCHVVCRALLVGWLCVVWCGVLFSTCRCRGGSCPWSFLLRMMCVLQQSRLEDTGCKHDPTH